MNLKTQRKVLPVIIIDEAQNLPHEFFSDLASFLNFNYDSEDIVTLWLVGNKQLMLKIKQARHNALSSRVRIYHDLKQIESFEEFKKFVTIQQILTAVHKFKQFSIKQHDQSIHCFNSMLSTGHQI